MARKFEIELLDANRFIKENDLKEITNPVTFNVGGPSTDGLLSNEIFGITKDERSGIFAYIDLKEKFINPYLYRVWLKIDRNLRGCVYETSYFKINKDGFLEKDDDGDTGIAFLQKNISKIKFKNTKKDELLQALMQNKDKMFIDKFIIIPPFYRDVNTGSDGRVGVGEINKLYVNLMNTIKGLSESNDYGLSMAGGVRGRVQDIMLEIYNWFTVGETVVGGEHTGSGIFKKFGIMRRSVMSKTTDNSARLVLSAPKIDVDSKEQLMVDLDYSAIPLSAACVISYPFLINELSSWFDNEFGGKTLYSNLNPKTNKVEELEIDQPQIQFSNDRFDKEIDEFTHGYSNRFKPLVLKCKEKDVRLRFKGYHITEEEYKNGIRENEKIIERDLTWVDLFYRCVTSAVSDKMAIITRYPMDSYFNQLYTEIHVSSTVNTEPMIINGKFYPWYPRIRQEDIGSDTSNKFVDTLSMANPYCKLMNADYDGDQVTVKMAYTIEANEELRKYKDSKAQFITLTGTNGRIPGNESIQAMYNLTLVLDKNKLSDPKF